MMIARLFLSLFAISILISYSNANINHNIQKCSSSPVHILLEKHYTGPPYRTVNFGRPASFYNVSLTKFSTSKPDDYDGDLEIGEGTAAKVFLATHKPTRDTIVIKYMKMRKVSVLREIKNLLELKDAPHFLPLRDVVDVSGGKSGFALIFDYFNHTSFPEVQPLITKKHMKVFAYQLLKSLDYMHSRGIIHRDIKPHNTLMNLESYQLKLIDVGQGEYFLPGKDYNIVVGSQQFKAPELLVNYTKYDYSIDMWSTGAWLAAMMFQDYYFFNPKTDHPNKLSLIEEYYRRLRDQLDAIAKILGTKGLLQYVNKYKDDIHNMEAVKAVGNYSKVPLKNLINEENAHMVDSLGIDLVERLLVYDHTRRLTARQALAHPYFSEVRKELEN